MIDCKDDRLIMSPLHLAHDRPYAHDCVRTNNSA